MEYAVKAEEYHNVFYRIRLVLFYVDVDVCISIMDFIPTYLSISTQSVLLPLCFLLLRVRASILLLGHFLLLLLLQHQLLLMVHLLLMLGI